jgi:hypothetical protein
LKVSNTGGRTKKTVLKFAGIGLTIDVSSKEILSVVRNYNRDTEQLPEPRQVFVRELLHFVPGMGFYDIGLLHILGNTTNAVTAAWRELLDAGMYNKLPGFLMADTGARQNTNIFRVPPRWWRTASKTGGMPITQRGCCHSLIRSPLAH